MTKEKLKHGDLFAYSRSANDNTVEQILMYDQCGNKLVGISLLTTWHTDFNSLSGHFKYIGNLADSLKPIIGSPMD